MKKILAFVLSLCLVGGLVACSGGSSPEAPPQAPSESTSVPVGSDKEPITLTFMGGAHLTSVVEIVLKDYLEANPHITIEYEKYSYSEYPTKMQLQLSNGDATPDIMLIHDELADQFVRSGWLLDLTDHVDTAQLMPLLDNATFNGSLYGIPNQATYFYTYMYRQDIYDEFNLTPPATWEEYYEQGLLLKEQGYYIGAVYPADAAEVYLWYMNMLGGGAFDREGNVTMDKGVEALELLQRGLDAGIFHESKQGSSDAGTGEFWTAYNDGLIAAFPSVTPQAAYYESNVDPDGNGGYGSLAIAPAMKFSADGPATFYGATEYFTVNAKSEHIDAALEIIQYLGMSIEASEAFSSVNEDGVMARYGTAYIPGLEALATNGSEGWNAFGGAQVVSEFAKIMLEQDIEPVPYKDYRWSQANDIIKQVLAETLVNGKYTAEQAVAEMIKQIEGL